MKHDDIEQAVLAEIKVAEDYVKIHSPKREKSWDRYYGRKLGNEVKGRSQFITREILDTIEWMMPYFMRTFASGDPKVDIEIKGQEPWVGKAMMDKIQIDLGDGMPNIFIVFYQWFKDALVSDTGFIKSSWDLDQENVKVSFPELGLEQMQMLTNDPEIDVTAVGKAEVMPELSFKDVEATIKKTLKNALYVENTPHWEFLADPKSRDVNDTYGKGQKTEVTLDYLKRIDRAMGGDYFKDLDALGEAKADIDNTEETNYRDENDLTSIDTEVGLKSPVKFIEWYTRLDIDDDGYLENIVCFMGNGKLLKYEEGVEFTPFSSLKPIIDCYKFYGISYAELLVEIQNLKTMLFRRILDNFDFQNSGRWLRDPNSNIDASALLNNIPGSVITGKIGGLKDLTPAPFNPATLSILEYVDTIKENRTGVSKANAPQGMDQQSMHKTAEGVIRIQNASMQRLELIGRLFAEIGLKDFYRKCVLLYQKNIREPFTAKVQGKERQITPDMIQGKVITRVNMGVTANVGAVEAEKIEKVLGVLFTVNDKYPGMLGPEQVHNLMSRYITSSGFKNVDDFIADLEQFLQQTKQASQSQQAQQQEITELQKKFKEMELALIGKEIEVKEKGVMLDHEMDKAELEQKGEIEMAKIAQKDQDSRRDQNLGFAKLGM